VSKARFLDELAQYAAPVAGKCNAAASDESVSFFAGRKARVGSRTKRGGIGCPHAHSVVGAIVRQRDCDIGTKQPPHRNGNAAAI